MIIYRILADSITALHFIWILFMLLGFFLNLQALCYKKEFFNRFWFRIIHLFGIFYVGALSLMGKYCPLTILENYLRSKYASDLTYPGSFIIYYLEKLVYPQVNPLVIQIPTALIAIFTILTFLFRPPKRLKNN